jgi:hypothetical protein
MLKNRVTFVTAYLNIYKDAVPLERHNEWRLRHFRVLAESGIQLCIILSPDCEDAIQEMAKEFPNIYILKTIDIQDTWVANLCRQYKNEFNGQYTLPSVRSIQKDTEEYIILQNSKMEFMNSALEKNPFGSSHFAWIDFSIAYMFQDIKKSQAQLRIISEYAVEKPGFLIPGCWGKWDIGRHDHHMEHIHWRFCGCFFLADKDTMSSFCRTYCRFFPIFLQEQKKLLWEVNVWAWLEHVSEWAPIWYDADHNDRCIQIPDEFIVKPLAIESSIVYPYPTVEHFHPSSAAYVQFKGKHILNTRYVNYLICDGGGYHYSDGSGIIQNKNFVSILDGDMAPLDYREMDAGTVDLHRTIFNPSSFGLEDIRLYVFQDRLRLIATNIDFSPNGRGRMIVGDYCSKTATYSNAVLIEPPNPDSWFEKNWIPIENRHDTGSEYFIYKWHPFEIGKLVKEDRGHRLEIVSSHEIHFPWFQKIRGSTCFQELDEGYLGLVHFSEEGPPRKYSHMMILLDKTTLLPIRASRPFCFYSHSVEFCIGFYKHFHCFSENPLGDLYWFWISRMDRDPLLISGQVRLEIFM